MKKSIIILLSFFIGFSCQNNNQPIKSKSSHTLEKFNIKPKEVSCYNVEKKIFHELISDMEIEGSKLHKLKDWHLRYKNHINPNIYNPNDTFIVLPEKIAWKGIKNIREYHNREITDIRFENTLISEVVVSQYTNNKIISNIKIVQFLFKSVEEAQKSTEKLKLISYYTINTDGLKNPNCWWIHDCAIYFCRVLSASSSFKPVIEAFEKKHGDVKIMRW